MPEENNRLKKQATPDHARDDRPENTARDAHKPAAGGQGQGPGQRRQNAPGSAAPMSREADKALGNRIEQGRQGKARPDAESGRKEQPQAERRPGGARPVEVDDADEEDEQSDSEEANPKLIKK